MMKRHPNADYEDLESEYDFGNEAGTSSKRQRIQDDELWKKTKPGEVGLLGRDKARNAFDDEHARFERQKRRLMTMDVYSRHKELINLYYLNHPGATSRLQRNTSKDRTDYDVIQSNHKFLWDEDELNKAAEKSWEMRLVKRYYDKLFKEYCIGDLSQYEKNRIGLRWRTENEVKSGKGQFECGNRRCQEKNDLSSWEVNFSYVEDGVKKNALVKIRLCPLCSAKLNYHSQKKRHMKTQKEGTRHKMTKNKEFVEKGSSNIVKNEAPSSSNIEDTVKEERTEEETLKRKAEEMLNIWKKPQDDLDPEKVLDQELDDILDDMLL